MSVTYIKVIQDMYEGARTSVRCVGGDTDQFLVNVGLHQGSALSPFLFAIVVDEVTKSIQGEVPWCMLFSDNVIFIDESKFGMNEKLERWRRVLESKGFRISRGKTEYMQCKFGGMMDESDLEVSLGGQALLTTNKFKYLGSIIQDNGEIDEDVSHRIKVGWTKWGSVTGVICDDKIPLRLKGKLYKTMIRPAMLYGVECWPTKKVHIQKLMVAEMRMLRWMCGLTLRDRVGSYFIRGKVSVAPIEDKLRESRLRWFGHVVRRPSNAPVRACEKIVLENASLGCRRGRGRPKKSWREAIKNDLKSLQLREDLATDRNRWRDRIKVKE